MPEQHGSRRQFLNSAAVGAALSMSGAAWTAHLRADDGTRPAARVDYCFSLYGMRSLKLADALRTCAKIGYDGVELDCGRGQSGDPDKLSAAGRRDVAGQLRDLRLSLPALMENLTLLTSDARQRANLDRLRTLGALGHQLSPGKPPVIETILGGRPEQWERDKEPMAAALGDWAKAAEAAQTVIAIKAHVGGALHTPPGAEWLLERVDSRWIRLNYDYSHFQRRGYKLEQSINRLIGKTAFIHVKDNTGRPGGAQRPRFLLPGEGNIDYAAYFQLLKRAGYRGAVCVEVSGQIFGQPGYEPAAAARTSYANLAPLLKQAKLRG